MENTDYLDVITIDRLEVFAHHGVLPFETKEGQKFYVSAQIFLDITKAAREDNLEETINYAQVCNLIKEIMTKDNYKLIETLALKICEEILIKYEIAKKVDIKIHKPNAPIDGIFRDISVSCSRKKGMAYLSIGANLGDRKETLDGAIDALKKFRGCKVLKVSDYIETEPYGYTNQDKFINAAVIVETIYNPKEFLDILHKIESDFGRERIIRWGPRTLDLDIVLFDDIIMDTEELTIPHIDMQNREFVLKPLSQIAGFKMHPILNKTVDSLYKEL